MNRQQDVRPDSLEQTRDLWSRPTVYMALGLLATIGLAAGLQFTEGAQADTYYVSPTGRSSYPGTKDQPISLARANDLAGPGVTFLLMGGRYGTAIAPDRSGTKDRPIVYKAASSGSARFDDLRNAVVLTEKGHVQIVGIAARKVHRWIVAERGAHHITIENCSFAEAKGWESCRFRESGNGIRLVNNTIRNGTDSVMIEGGDNHVVKGNAFLGSSHTCLVLMGVQRSVISDNEFRNPRQKCFEVFTTRDRRGIPKRLSERNLIEGNVFGPTVSSGIQYAGNRSIIRRNVFRGCKTGISWSNYISKRDYPEAWYNENNRFYHNTLYGNGTAILLVTQKRSPAARGKGLRFSDNLMVNNILFKNKANLGKKCDSTVQIAFDWDSRPADAGVFGNCMLGDKSGRGALYWCDANEGRRRHRESLPLKEWEKLYPRNAGGNIEADPGLVSPDRGDFRLSEGSPCIDKARPLTKVKADSRGKVVAVDDALYFCDGFGVVAPDMIRVGGKRAKAVHVDHETNKITLDRPLTTTAGDPVNLDYVGDSPDIGAFEFDTGH